MESLSNASDCLYSVVPKLKFEFYSYYKRAKANQLVLQKSFEALTTEERVEKAGVVE
jgi:hypothetical protein